jgi:uncharacterized protein YifE (UPF0438 family)
VSILSGQPLTKEVLLKRVFSDPKNYPYGFSRSGDFSISESKALAEYGCYIAALIDGHIQPQNSDDTAILAAAHGDIEPKDTAQRAWLKYQKRINRPKTGSIYGTKKVASQEDDDLVNDIDDDVNIDIDD